MQITSKIHSVGASIYIKSKSSSLWFYCFSVPRKKEAMELQKKQCLFYAGSQIKIILFFVVLLWKWINTQIKKDLNRFTVVLDSK